MIGVVEKRPNGSAGAKTIKISVSRAGKDALEQMAGKYGMKEQEIGGRIYEWFMAQDSIVQRAVLGLLHDLEVDAAARFMQRLAEEAQKKAPTGGKGNPRLTPRMAVRTADGAVHFEE